MFSRLSLAGRRSLVALTSLSLLSTGTVVALPQALARDNQCDDIVAPYDAVKVTTNSKFAPAIGFGETVDVTVTGVPAGTHVNSLGLKVNHEGSPITFFQTKDAAATTPDDKGTVVIKGVTLKDPKNPDNKAIIGQDLGVMIKVGTTTTKLCPGIKVVDGTASTSGTPKPEAPKPVEEKGRENFDITSKTLDTDGALYQSGYSAKENALFVTSAYSDDDEVHKNPAAIYKFDAKTLEVKQKLTLPVPTEAYPDKDTTDEAAKKHWEWAAYGVAVDDELGLLWVTNSLQDTVSVYKTSDLSLVRHFPMGVIARAHGLALDPATHKVYVTSSRGFDAQGKPGKKPEIFTDGRLFIFDGTKVNDPNYLNSAADFQKPENVIVVPGAPRLIVPSFNKATGEIVVPSFIVPKVVKIDTRAGNKVTTFDMTGKGIARISGATTDENKNIYITGNKSGNVGILKEDGTFIKAIPTDAGSLNINYNPADKNVYVSNFAANTVSVIDTQKQDLVAQLKVGATPLYITNAPDGGVFVNTRTATDAKSGKDKQDGAITNNMVKITAKKAAQTDDLSANLPAIIGGVIGGVALLLATVFAAFRLHLLPDNLLPAPLRALIQG